MINLRVLPVLRLCLMMGIFFLFSFLVSPSNSNKPRILVFSKTKGWRHSSIPFGISAIQKLGKEYGFEVDTTEDSRDFNEGNLKKYQAVVFNNTIGNILNAMQQAAFERYIQAGGGYVGIHASAATEYDWAWFEKLNGAHLAHHPHNPNVREAVVEIVDKTHISTKDLPHIWKRMDEWYNYKSFYPGINVLAKLDENTYEGGTNGSLHPISWYHSFDGGRAFYTGCGHTDESFNDPLFLKHLLGGIQYAIGKGQGLDYSKSYSKVAPDQNRFVKTVLVNDLNSPMELAISNDGRIYYTEFGGKLSVYNTLTHQNKSIHQWDVSTVGGTGLIGVALDPNFTSNNWIYLYYSPPTDQEPIIFNLSRFTLNGDSIDLASEKILLKVPVQKNSGSHHGGSLSWDKEGNLYLSTGDSSSPFPSNGYAPLDEREGKEFYSLDAQRSASNTNDFKGKILRIHPEENGSYTIPKGNLFVAGTPGTLPEIYVMGVRNPYRIAINPTSSVLYWGDIGPDAGKDSLQGPRGYDEFNQAREAGNFGWPYFIATNMAYNEWNFATQTPGSYFDPKAPVNNSPNNTGLKNLPPAKPAMIWYPYAASKEFPELGVGGRSGMAGAVYSFDKNSSSKNKFPEYYDNCLFVFEWMRNWVKSIHFDQNENYLRNESFMPVNGDFRRPIDLAFGKDGVMYMLEYGSVYKADNPDARLVKIEYNYGNRPPVAKAGVTDSALTAHVFRTVFLTSEFKNIPGLENVTGQPPLRVLFNSNGTSDPDDDDKISYEWFFDGKTLGATSANPVYTYTEAGIYNAVLRVTDSFGLTSSDTVTIKVGNSTPEISIITPNKTFFWEDTPLSYEVKVKDKEDGKIDSKKVKVFFHYSKQPIGDDGTQKQTTLGATLLTSSDCKACHTMDKTSVGPSYLAIANRYKNQPGSVNLLAKKIIRGGGGSWGKEYVMSAHPQLEVTEAEEIVEYIFSLTDSKKNKKALPLKGLVKLNEHKEDEPEGRYTLEASYTDLGGKKVGPLTGKDAIILRKSKVPTVYADEYMGFPRFANKLNPGSHKSFLLFKDIDLTGINQFIYHYSSKDKNGEIEVRVDSQAGPIISRTSYSSTGDWKTMQSLTGQIQKKVNGTHDVYFIAIKRDPPNGEILQLAEIDFEK